MFCTGNENICPAGSVETLNDEANKANEDVCVGKSRGKMCVQTKACDC